MPNRNNDEIRQAVRENYAKVASSSGCCCDPACCGKPSDAQTAAAASVSLGYSEHDVASVPDGSNMGLGCGNPQAIAALRPGETVLDLGCGGGFDSFLAAQKVGENGRVIGVDMTPEMVAKARRNVSASGRKNIDIRLGEIENLPVANASVDVIISNCVINLSPDKQRVFNEAFRVLKTGGRLAVSDIVALRPMPDALKQDKQALCGCISGAAPAEEVSRMLAVAGFQDVRVDLKPESREFIKDWAPGSGAESYVCSAIITAGKKA